MTINSLLADTGSHLDENRTGDIRAARRHMEASKLICSHYRSFERIRTRLFKGIAHTEQMNETERCLIESMQACGLIRRERDGAFKAHSAASRRFITGGWLEEISCLAAKEAGADEALFGQQIVWRHGNYHGENEIDVLARFGSRLAFYSCKAYGANYRNRNDRGRKKLMEALHEADNLADHFGNGNSFVGLILSSDLYDEYNRKPKYEALFGKARALNVDLITLEDLRWDRLVNAMGRPLLEK